MFIEKSFFCNYISYCSIIAVVINKPVIIILLSLLHIKLFICLMQVSNFFLESHKNHLVWSLLFYSKCQLYQKSLPRRECIIATNIPCKCWSHYVTTVCIGSMSVMIYFFLTTGHEHVHAVEQISTVFFSKRSRFNLVLIYALAWEPVSKYLKFCCLQKNLPCHVYIFWLMLVFILWTFLY